MSAQRRSRWNDIGRTLLQCLVFDWQSSWHEFTLVGRPIDGLQSAILIQSSIGHLIGLSDIVFLFTKWYTILQSFARQYRPTALTTFKLCNRRVDIPPDPRKIITKSFSTVFYPTGYSEWQKKSLSKSDPEKSENPRWPPLAVKIDKTILSSINLYN